MRALLKPLSKNDLEIIKKSSDENNPKNPENIMQKELPNKSTSKLSEIDSTCTEMKKGINDKINCNLPEIVEHTNNSNKEVCNDTKCSLVAFDYDSSSEDDTCK